jgi:23S rRNA (guanosine2251-2'-O)-methyltransferase
MNHRGVPSSTTESPPEKSGIPSRAPLAAGYEGLRLPAVVLLDNVRSMYNVGAFFRAADGVALEKLYLCGITAHPPKKAISKTALGAEETVAWEHNWDAIEAIEQLRHRGFQIAAIETGPHSMDLFQWEPRFPLCVMFGHEVDGLRPELLQMADAHVRIPMLGQKRSLNVATAGGIVMYELLRKYKGLKTQTG